MRSKVIANIFTILQLILLVAVLIILANRDSATSTAIFGRYSKAYASFLAVFAVYTGLWLFVLLAQLQVKGFKSLIEIVTTSGAGIMLSIFLLWTWHIFLILFFSAANMDALPMQLMLITILVGTIALILSASPQASENLKQNGGIVIFSVLISYAMIEIMLRIVYPLGLPGYNGGEIWREHGEVTDWRQYVGWSPPANGEYYAIMPGEYYTLVQTNSHGLHDSEYEYEKPEGVFRILVLGDSFTYAREVALEATFHQLLEVQLNEAMSTEIEIIAAASGGWGTDQQLLYFEHEGYRYDPDLVILQFTSNDLLNNITPGNKPSFTLEDGELVLNSFPYAVPTQLQPGRDFIGFFLMRSRTLFVMWQVITTSVDRYTNFGGVQGEVFQVGASDSEDEVRSFMPLTTALIAELNTTVQEHDAQFVGFRLPIKERLENQLFLETLDALDIPYLPTELIDVETEQNPYLEIDGHFSETGHALMATALTEWLLAEEFVPAD